MTETVTTIGAGLLIWWSAMTVLCLRDYCAKKKESKEKGPLNEQERAEIENIRSELPQKKQKPAWWYISQPKEGAKLGAGGLLILPFAIIFLPMLLMLLLLPDPNRK